jgi:uncharacterized protein (TIGR02391 family)
VTQSYSGPATLDQVRDLSTPQLAVVLLRDFARSPEQVALDGLFRNRYYVDATDSQNVLGRLSDAWSWLEAHALVGLNPSNPTSNYRRLTAAGRDLAVDDHALTRLWAGERLTGKFDSSLASALNNFHFGDYATACFAATKEVEVAVRDASGLGNDLIGVKLMQEAFKPDGGPLTDAEAEGGERVAMMQLFAGAIGTFKNPTSHRPVDYEDPVEAAEIIQLADLLLRIVRRAARSR